MSLLNGATNLAYTIKKLLHSIREHKPEEQEYTPHFCDWDYMAAQAVVMSRPIVKVVQGVHAMEGAGVRICRTLGTSSLKNLDPYLMLDELKCESKAAAAGFPNHPHRGFETCTIMLEGAMDHADSVGNKGTIQAGGVQWMTAGADCPCGMRKKEED